MDPSDQQAVDAPATRGPATAPQPDPYVLTRANQLKPLWSLLLLALGPVVVLAALGLLALLALPWWMGPVYRALPR